jgi:hypothetical protein
MMGILPSGGFSRIWKFIQNQMKDQVLKKDHREWELRLLNDSE